MNITEAGQGKEGKPEFANFQIIEKVICNRIWGGPSGYGFGTQDQEYNRDGQTMEEVVETLGKGSLYFKLAKRARGIVVIDGQQVEMVSNLFGMSKRYVVDGVLREIQDHDGVPRIVVLTRSGALGRMEEVPYKEGEVELVYSISWGQVKEEVEERANEWDRERQESLSNSQLD